MNSEKHSFFHAQKLVLSKDLLYFEIALCQKEFNICSLFGFSEHTMYVLIFSLLH